jgi:cyclopropane fatty-acyl-phospholipid synthase-like methyltransferase
MKAFWAKLSRWLRFNLFYVGRPPWDTGVSPPELINFLEKSEPGRALDLGCGTGTNLKTMAKAGWQVVGIELAWLSILKARAKLRRNGVEGRVIYGDVAGDPDVKPPFELILDIGCFHSLSPSERDNYRENIKAWLSPKGTLLMYAHRRTSTEHTHGIIEGDLSAFESFLYLQWWDDGDEVRPDGGGGYPATWVRFDRESESLR